MYTAIALIAGFALLLGGGEMLVVEATDPNTMRDMAALCEAAGFTLLSSEEQNGVFVFRIQQAA